jgi:hypothetical protein
LNFNFYAFIVPVIAENAKEMEIRRYSLHQQRHCWKEPREFG